FYFSTSTLATVLYTLSLHDALPIYSSATVKSAPSASKASSTATPSPSPSSSLRDLLRATARVGLCPTSERWGRYSIMRPPSKDRDRKSTRLNSSHVKTSYAVFCSKK